MAYVREYKCGCIIHDMAGTIRKCAGNPKGSFSMSGRPVKMEGNENQHAKALEKPAKETWEVADILP